MLRQLCVAFIFTLVASGVYAGSAITVSGASRDKIKNELVLQLTRTNEFRLVGDTSFQITFERDADHSSKKPLYQSNVPVDRFTFTIADTYPGAQVATSVALVENSGTPLERHTNMQTGKEAQEAQDIVVSIKNRLNALNVKALTMQPVRLAQGSISFRRSYRPKTASSVPVVRKTKSISAIGRLGFSAKPSREDDSGGLEITAVDPKTPAAEAGLQPSDVVVAFDGQPVTTNEMETVRDKLLNHRRGAFKVIRNGKVFEAMLKL